MMRRGPLTVATLTLAMCMDCSRHRHLPHQHHFYTTTLLQGILAEILEPIMGKGLIPADNETWKVRRRAIVPAFHQKWLEHMVGCVCVCLFVCMWTSGWSVGRAA